jgi:hypothetical protein
LINFGERSLAPRRVFPSPQAAEFRINHQWMFASQAQALNPGVVETERAADLQRRINSYHVTEDELLHLKVPNHGKLFKALEKVYGGEVRR